jgi:uncharacterized membrane protein
MRLSLSDLMVPLAAVLSAVVLLGFPSSGNPLHVLLTLMLVFGFPGYATVLALIPRGQLSSAERLAYSLGASLAIAAIGGLALNWVPGGLRKESWAVLLTSVTVVASTIAFLRRNTHPEAEIRPRRAISLPRRQCLILSGAALVGLAAYAIARVGALNEPVPGLTQLWILPHSGGASPNTVDIGINSIESGRKTYTLELELDGEPVRTWPSITLERNQVWQTSLTLPNAPRADGTIEAVLFEEQMHDRPFRHVVLRIPFNSLKK